MNSNISTFIGCDTEYENADLVIFGAPFDGTTSFRPGTRFGPDAIRRDSFGLETYSPYQDRDLSEIKACDIGDLELPFGNTERVLSMIEDTATRILNDGKIPVMLGGEHLVTLGAMRAVTKKYDDIYVIHLDAHTDLRDEYLGEKLSHSTVIRRVWDIIGDDRIFQFGIRSGERYEFMFAKEHTHLRKFDLEGFENVIKALKGHNVYFTLDLDILDPSVFCGTGTPEAGGVTFTELLNAVCELGDIKLVGCDVNELSPVYDQSGASTAVACKILRELLLTFKGE